MILLQILALVGIGALGLLLYRYLPAYAAEKGKNLATKEDIAEITRQIEGVKSGYAHELESVRAAIGSRLGIHQFRYQREFESLVQLSEKVVELRDATVMLRPESEYVNPEEPEQDRKQRKLTRYTAASRDLYQFYEPRRPFLPEALLESLRVLDQVAWHEVIQFRHRAPHGDGYDPKYWDNALENAAKIQAASDAVLLAIRQRAQTWERFDPNT
ncbi:MAG: hypothetical protein OJF47_002413 [Nitrospira sp.]|jgi:hypothetical protein|nr:MAG: hypothetical protein OJF47_002413 [Nitrospira sp.]